MSVTPLAVGSFLINSIVENVLKPRFMKESFQIPLLLIVLSLMVWTWVLGPMGTILGIPLTVVLLRVCREYSAGGSSPGTEQARP